MDSLLLRRRLMMSGREDYIVFADPLVEQICANAWGDGIGLTPSRAARVTNSQLATAFYNNTAITSFDEFQYFTGVNELQVVEGTGSNAKGPFYNCTSLTAVTLPSGITILNDACFKNCTKLVRVSGGGNIRRINQYAFCNDSKLEVLPSLTEVTYIGRYCCCGTTSLNIDLDLRSLTSIDSYGVCFRRSGITKVLSLGTITSLPNGAGDSGGMFYSATSLTYVDIPETVASITRASFRYCSRLQTVIVRRTTPPTLANGNEFNNTNNTFKFYVPYSSDHSVLDAYKAANRWSVYASRIYELDADGNIPT